jgi:hypothetical protein
MSPTQTHRTPTARARAQARARERTLRAPDPDLDPAGQREGKVGHFGHLYIILLIAPDLKKEREKTEEAALRTPCPFVVRLS